MFSSARNNVWLSGTSRLRKMSYDIAAEPCETL